MYEVRDEDRRFYISDYLLLFSKLDVVDAEILYTVQYIEFEHSQLILYLCNFTGALG